MARVARLPEGGSLAAHERTVGASLAQLWVMFGVLHGLNADELCGACGFRTADIADRDRQVPRTWYVALRLAVIERLPNVDVGIELGRVSSPGQLGYIALAMQCCATPLDALRLMMRFAAIFDSAAAEIGPRVEIGETLVDWVVPRSLEDPPEAIESIFIGCAGLVSWLTGTKAAPVRVRFSRHRESLRARLEEHIGAPVEFGCSDDRMSFARSDLERPIARADAHIVHHAVAQLDKQLGEQKVPFLTVVARTVEAHLPNGGVSQEQTARRLGLSTRTLQRKLSACGKSYQEIADGVRRGVAERLLLDHSLSIYEVAFGSGYESVTSFNRAFKRWSGSNPLAYRRAHASKRDGRQFG